jgi:nucleotide-binding universal stress UspA family protein
VQRANDVPVLVGRQPARLLKENLRVLWSLALDDSDASALDSVAQLARTRRVTLDVMHVRAMPADAHRRHEAMQLAERDARERLASLPANVTLRRVLTSDGRRPIHEEIARAAHDADTDLIICGSHHRRGLARLAAGSVAERIVQEAPVSVQVAPV